jgi:SAM-dependent methyltransferase
MSEPTYLAAVRRSYDTVAADYVERVKNPAELDALSRAMFAAFAELVRGADLGPVADVGCGPGQLTAHLAGLGLSAFGIDLSPKMIELARQAFPSLRFDVGSMTELDLGDNELGGIMAYYSTHHTPPELLPVVFAEFHRTLAAGGHLMLGGRVGEHEHLRPAQAYGGHPVSYESYFLPADDIAELLVRAGLVVTAQLTQQPDEGARRPGVTFLAHKPEQPHGPHSVRTSAPDTWEARFGWMDSTGGEECRYGDE